ncbi:alpha/beta fold hydrolase [Alteribacter keqinensis]|uniref:Alpha/beta fold hydrolase n=1 Tax=Alteribacter keqinensis TaxID=2483800 RepID=A0A3M7TMH3_9BACI|nr:alpha/beta fold hydrolase [Alteribacter keqinensis]RNA66578.1 alpha/beta fold hydrolase [Alteribacter keqinensis]
MNSKKKSVKKVLFYLALGFIFLIFAGITIVLIWASNGYEAEYEVRSYIEDEGNPDERTGLSFGSGDETTGVIVYPGGRVDHKAYSYLAYRLSEEGYFVYVPRMPLDLPVLNMNRAGAVMEKYPQVDNWYVAGHSLGGAMGAYYTANHPETVEGMIFLASYPGNDLTESGVPVLSVYGGLDGVSTPEEIMERDDRLPEETTYVEIPDGNHANFGWYGAQRGDLESPLTPQEQQDIVAEEIARWIEGR